MNILIVHTVHSIMQEILTIKGHKVDILLKLSREEILKVLPKYDGLVVRSALKIDKEVIDAGSRLKFIGRLGAGMENIDSDYATSKGIKLHNAPEGNRSAVGEHALGLLLSLYNNLNRADAEVRKGIWLREANRGEEIEGKTIGIIGYGNMGSAFAKKLQGFDANVIAYDKYKTNFGNELVKEVSLQTIFDTADIVSLHTPLQEDTLGMVDSDFLSSFAKQITLINTSRGAVVKTCDLVNALQNKQIKGACLDVLEFEGMSFEEFDTKENNDVFNSLKQSQNVILSPHIAGWTHQSNKKMARILAEKIL